MSNHFPTPSGMHVDNLQYTVSLAQISNEAGQWDMLNADFGLLNFAFDTGVSGGTISYSYSSFDQDATEADLASALDSLAGEVATLLGLTTAAVQDKITVTRQWSIETTSESAAGFTPPYSSYVITDTMTYPA